MRNPPGPMRMLLVCMSAWATRRSGEGCGSQGAVWCSPIHASLKPNSSAQRSCWRSHRCPSYRLRSGGCDGIVNSPYSMRPSFPFHIPCLVWKMALFQKWVVLENSNIAQLASNPYPKVHSRSKEDRHDTEDASARKIYDIFVPQARLSAVQSTQCRQHWSSLLDR